VTRALGIIAAVLLLVAVLLGLAMLHYHKVSVRLDGEVDDLQVQLDSANAQIVDWSHQYNALGAEHSRVLSILSQTERDKQTASAKAAALREELRKERANDKCAATAVPAGYAAVLHGLQPVANETVPTPSAPGAEGGGARAPAGPNPAP
jgi:Tfp pilus assembly protein PilX